MKKESIDLRWSRRKTLGKFKGVEGNGKIML